MDSLDFMTDATPGTLLVRIWPSTLHEATDEIQQVNLNTLKSAAPKIAASVTPFANSEAKSDKATHLLLFEGHSKASIVCLLRFIYIRDYLASEGLLGRPCSMLLHFQMFKLGELYEIPELTAQAYFHALRECEQACSIPPMVIDLCDAIRFLYLELPKADSLLDVVVNYCIECYIYHGLGKSEEFQQTVYEAPDFHQLLLKRNLERGFESDGAMDIIKTKCCDHDAHHSPFPFIRDAARFMCHLHSCEVNPARSDKRPIWRQPTEYTIVHASRFPTGIPTTEEADILTQEYLAQDEDVLRFRSRNDFDFNPGPSDPGPRRRFYSPPRRSVQMSPPPPVPKIEDFIDSASRSRWASFPQRQDNDEVVPEGNRSLADAVWDDPRYFESEEVEEKQPLIPGLGTAPVSANQPATRPWDVPPQTRWPQQPLTVTNLSDADLAAYDSDEAGYSAEPPRPIAYDPHPQHSQPIPSDQLSSALHRLASVDCQGGPAHRPTVLEPNQTDSNMTMLERYPHLFGTGPPRSNQLPIREKKPLKKHNALKEALFVARAIEKSKSRPTTIERGFSVKLSQSKQHKGGDNGRADVDIANNPVGFPPTADHESGSNFEELKATEERTFTDKHPTQAHGLNGRGDNAGKTEALPTENEKSPTKEKHADSALKQESDDDWMQIDDKDQRQDQRKDKGKGRARHLPLGDGSDEDWEML